MLKSFILHWLRWVSYFKFMRNYAPDRMWKYLQEEIYKRNWHVPMLRQLLTLYQSYLLTTSDFVDRIMTQIKKFVD